MPNTDPEKEFQRQKARIAALLRRKKLKGEEVGQALLLSLVSDYRQRNLENPDPLFTQSDLQQMEAALPSDYERALYADYIALRNNLLSLFRQAQGQLQQLTHGLFRLSTYVSLADRVRLLQLRVAPLTGLDGDPKLPEDLRRLFPEDFEDLLRNPERQAELLLGRSGMVLPAYAALAGYNAMVGIFAEGLPLPELQTLCIQLELVRSQADGYDRMVAESIAAQQKEYSILLWAILPPLSLEQIQPDAESIRILTERVRENGPGGCDAFVALNTVLPRPPEEA